MEDVFNLLIRSRFLCSYRILTERSGVMAFILQSSRKWFSMGQFTITKVWCYESWSRECSSVPWRDNWKVNITYLFSSKKVNPATQHSYLTKKKQHALRRTWLKMGLNSCKSIYQTSCCIFKLVSLYFNVADTVHPSFSPLTRCIIIAQTIMRWETSNCPLQCFHYFHGCFFLPC